VAATVEWIKQGRPDVLGNQPNNTETSKAK